MTGMGAHAAHRNLARLHDVAVLNNCHMTSIEQVCQRRHQAMPREAGSAIAGGKRRKVRRMQLWTEPQTPCRHTPACRGGVARYRGHDGGLHFGERDPGPRLFPNRLEMTVSGHGWPGPAGSSTVASEIDWAGDGSTLRPTMTCCHRRDGCAARASCSPGRSTCSPRGPS